MMKYCLISIFGLRPPELLGVFRNPIDYYRYCRIDENEILSESKVADMLSQDISSCKLVDSRQFCPIVFVNIDR